MKAGKKRRSTVAILVLIMTTVLGSGLHNAFAAQKQSLAQVNQPKLSASGVATWTNVANAKKYQVQLYINGTVQGTPKTVTNGKTGYNFLPQMRAAGPGSYTVKVSAKGDGKLYSDGPNSKASTPQVIKQLAQIAQPKWTGNTIKWLPGANVATYEAKLYKNDSVIKTYSVLSATTSIDLDSMIAKNSPGAFTVTVQAKGKGLYVDGRVSKVSDMNIKSTTLDKVGKPILSALGVATWQNVANAANYKVQIYLNDSALGAPKTVTSGDKGYNFLPVMRETGSGSYTVKVTAIGDDISYLEGTQSIASDPQVISKAADVSTPSFSSAGLVTWSTTNATSYDLNLYKDGNVTDVQKGASSGYNYLEVMRGKGAGKYAVTVTPKSDTGLVIDGDESALSESQTINMLTQPSQPVWSSDTISWSADLNAANYEVKLFKDGNLIDTQTIPAGTNSLNYSQIISKNAAGDFKVTVQSKGVGLYIDSEVSILSASNMKTVKLSTVEKPILTGTGVGTWENVQNATGYSVQLYLNGKITGDPQNAVDGQTGYDFLPAIKANGQGRYTFKVTAIGHGAYYNSDESEASNQQISGPQYLSGDVTVENTFEQATNVDTSRDEISIRIIDPGTSLTADTKNTITVEIEYNLVSHDHARLSIYSNTGDDYNSYYDISHFEIFKGSGKLRFELSFVPKSWSEGPSILYVNMDNFPDVYYTEPDYWSNGTQVNLNVK